MLLEQEIDVVTFTSASTVRNFVKLIGDEPAADLLRTTLVASIGPITADAARQLGIDTTIMPTAHTVPALVDAIADHFRVADPARRQVRASRELDLEYRHKETPMTLTPPASDNATSANSLPLTHRPRRLRRTRAIRDLVRETRLAPETLVYPLFVCAGSGIRQEVPSMPGVFQLSVDRAVAEAAAAAGDGIRGVLLFGLPESKDEIGSAADDTGAPVQAAVRAIKQEVADLLVITDVCLCEYTSHGHCGILEGDDIVNDATVDRLARVAVSHADAGADLVAPSDMMDGRVAAIREALDAAQVQRCGHHVLRRASTARPTMGRFVMPPAPRRRSVTDAPTRWTRPTSRRRSGKSRSISRKEPTSS